MWPSGLKGEVATQNIFWVSIQAMCSGCSRSQKLTMAVASTKQIELLARRTNRTCGPSHADSEYLDGAPV